MNLYNVFLLGGHITECRPTYNDVSKYMYGPGVVLSLCGVQIQLCGSIFYNILGPTNKKAFI